LHDDRSPSSAPSGATHAADELLGTVIDGRYRVESLLGEGGMGFVYRVTHTRLRKVLAIKVLRDEGSRDPSAMARFQREAESASAIGNAHIVDVSDFGTLPDDSTYFVMECLEGVDLVSAIEAAGPMPVERACYIATQLCRALGAAHDAGIVHRDLKPENVFLIDRDGDPDFVKVLDFGIAKVTHGPSRLTQETAFLGTPHYMSPEQCEGLGIDHRTDIYGLGVLLYEMVAARVPHDADTAMAILHKHVYERPTPIDLYVPRISPSLKRIIGRCLEKKPERRYQSMGELRADLERLQQAEAGQSARLLSDWRNQVRFDPKHSRVWMSLLAAAVIAFLGAMASGAFSTSRPEPSASADSAKQSVPLQTERGVPESLALPEGDSAGKNADHFDPPASLAPANEPSRVETAPRSRKPARKRLRKPLEKPKPRQNPASQDEVLDPWM
jgi:serine/threonine protein kinase